jgi:hypothetical protein
MLAEYAHSSDLSQVKLEDHYYILSRFLISRVLMSTKVLSLSLLCRTFIASLLLVRRLNVRTDPVCGCSEDRAGAQESAH